MDFDDSDDSDDGGGGGMEGKARGVGGWKEEE